MKTIDKPQPFNINLPKQINHALSQITTYENDFKIRGRYDETISGVLRHRSTMFFYHKKQNYIVYDPEHKGWNKIKFTKLNEQQLIDSIKTHIDLTKNDIQCFTRTPVE